MSQMNRGEALRCIQIAKKCISEGKMAKAEKFLTKSLRMYDTKEAKALLESLKNPPSSSSNPPPSSQPSSTSATPNQSVPPQSSANSSAASSQGASRSGSSRMTTDDEVQMIRHILRSKDYYSTLGVSKDADEKELKKAYRKKALKCHPDRNKAPGAEEAFKKLSKAYDVLRDPRKKQIYDQYGEDSPQMSNASRGAQFQQMTPDDIIRMFFGGDFGPGFGGATRGGFHFHSGGFPQRRRRQQGDAQQGGVDLGSMANLMQLLPLLLVFMTMILPSLMTFGGNNQSGGGRGAMEGTYFSLEKQHPFTMEKRTDKLDTVYYVQPQRRGSWGYRQNKSPRMEREVEGAYLRKLIKACEAEQEREDLRINKILSNDIDAKERRRLLKKLMKGKRKFDKMDSKQCRKLLDYVGEL